MNLEQLKYPAGKPNYPRHITFQDIINWIREIENFPYLVKEEVNDLTNEELSNYHYREGSWNIKQVVNHCIDSHINSFIRFKLALTEENPTIKPYKEELWAELADTKDYNINESIMLLSLIHKRWVFLLRSLEENDFKKVFTHPDGNETITLATNTYLYAWHCRNHLGHIKNAKKYKYA